jgi:hypothetical protein
MQRAYNENHDKTKKFQEQPYDATIRRSEHYADKNIESEGNVEIRGIKYYQRIFTDGCAELVRYDADAKMWAILCFPSEDK